MRTARVATVWPSESESAVAIDLLSRRFGFQQHDPIAEAFERVRPEFLGGVAPRGAEPDGGRSALEARPVPIKATPVRHPRRSVAMAVVTVLGAMPVHTLVTNPRFQWGVVAQSFTTHNTLLGLWVTIELTLLSMGIGIVLGTVLAVMRLFPNPLVSSASRGHIWIFRGYPVIVQILSWNFIAALCPTLSIGLPFGPAIAHGDADQIVTPFVTVLGLA